MPLRIIGLLLLTSFPLVSNADSAQAIFAGGCFWCMEYEYQDVEGVSDVISGFTGGTAKNPTYQGDHTGHYEAVEITYDPEVVTYQQLLDHFWVNIDPFDARGQFCDKGPSYLSAIFVATPEERELAEKSKQKVVERFPQQTVVMPILNASKFYPIRGAESGHQDFYKKSPVRYKTYRWGCGRDRRLEEVWGPSAAH